MRMSPLSRNKILTSIASAVSIFVVISVILHKRKNAIIAKNLLRTQIEREARTQSEHDLRTQSESDLRTQSEHDLRTLSEHEVHVHHDNINNYITDDLIQHRRLLVDLRNNIFLILRARKYFLQSSIELVDRVIKHIKHQREEIDKLKDKLNKATCDLHSMSKKKDEVIEIPVHEEKVDFDTAFNVFIKIYGKAGLRNPDLADEKIPLIQEIFDNKDNKLTIDDIDIIRSKIESP